MSNVIYLSDDNFNKEVLEYSGVVLVDFWAEWCNPCRMLGPIIEDVAKELAGKAKICKIDVDRNPVKTQEYEINTIPTLILFKDGKMIDKKIGVVAKNKLIEWVSNVR